MTKGEYERLENISRVNLGVQWTKILIFENNYICNNKYTK